MSDDLPPELAEVIARALDLARDFARTRDGDLARVLVCNLASDLDLARARARVLAGDRARVRVLSRVLARARVLAQAIARDFDPDRDRDFARDLDLVLDLDRALVLVLDLDRAQRTAAVASGWRRGKRQSATAQRLLAAGAWVLPVDARSRYGEEFGSELAEIALAGGGRFTQLAYAARVIVSSARLRTALVSPQRQGAVP